MDKVLVRNIDYIVEQYNLYFHEALHALKEYILIFNE